MESYQLQRQSLALDASLLTRDREQGGAYDASSSSDGAQGDNGQDGQGDGGSSSGEQKSSAPQNNQATQLQSSSKLGGQVSTEGQEDDGMQSQKADGQGEMDSGDILAYSGEISGQTAAPDLLEEKEAGSNQASPSSEQSSTPDKSKQPSPQSPTPPPAPAPKKEVAASPIVAQPQPAAAVQQKATTSEPPTHDVQQSNNKAMEEKANQAIQTNKERQLQTQRDMQEAQTNLQKEDEEIQKLQKLESSEEEQNNLIEQKMERVKVAQQNLQKTKEKIEKLKKEASEKVLKRKEDMIKAENENNNTVVASTSSSGSNQRQIIAGTSAAKNQTIMSGMTVSNSQQSNEQNSQIEKSQLLTPNNVVGQNLNMSNNNSNLIIGSNLNITTTAASMTQQQQQHVSSAAAAATLNQSQTSAPTNIKNMTNSGSIFTAQSTTSSSSAAVVKKSSSQSAIQAKIAAIKAHTAELKKQTQSNKALMSKIKKIHDSTQEQKKQQKNHQKASETSTSAKPAVQPVENLASQQGNGTNTKPSPSPSTSSDPKHQLHDQNISAINNANSSVTASNVVDTNSKQTKGQIDLEGSTASLATTSATPRKQQGGGSSTASGKQSLSRQGNAKGKINNEVGKRNGLNQANATQNLTAQSEKVRKFTAVKQQVAGKVGGGSSDAKNGQKQQQQKKIEGKKLVGQKNELSQSMKSKGAQNEMIQQEGVGKIVDQLSNKYQNKVQSKLKNQDQLQQPTPSNKALIKGKSGKQQIAVQKQNGQQLLTASKKAALKQQQMQSQSQPMQKASMVSHVKGSSDFVIEQQPDQQPQMMKAADQQQQQLQGLKATKYPARQLQRMATVTELSPSQRQQQQAQQDQQSSAASAAIDAGTLDDTVSNEDIDASPETLMKLRQVMNQDTTSAIIEGMVQSDPVEMMQKEKEENDRAAAEAAKDLFDDFGEPATTSPSTISQQDPTQQMQEEDNLQSVQHVSRMNSLETTLHSTSIHRLSTSPKDLDSLIGASSALEMADGDTEYLKRYSERVAMEADESDQIQKDEEKKKEEIQMAKIRQKQAHEAGEDFSVENARELAAKLNAQLEIGVAQAEAKKVQADLAYKSVITQRQLGAGSTKKSRIK